MCLVELCVSVCVCVVGMCVRNLLSAPWKRFLERVFGCEKGM